MYFSLFQIVDFRFQIGESKAKSKLQTGYRVGVGNRFTAETQSRRELPNYESGMKARKLEAVWEIVTELKPRLDLTGKGLRMRIDSSRPLR
jgi:hypothetical protein